MLVITQVAECTGCLSYYSDVTHSLSLSLSYIHTHTHTHTHTPKASQSSPSHQPLFLTAVGNSGHLTPAVISQMLDCNLQYL